MNVISQLEGEEEKKNCASRLNCLIMKSRKTASRAKIERNNVREKVGKEMEVDAAETWHGSLKRGILLIL